MYEIINLYHHRHRGFLTVKITLFLINTFCMIFLKERIFFKIITIINSLKYYK